MAPSATGPSASEFGFSAAQTVAVIGAGISGVSTAAHLLKQGLSVTVFERSSVSGGVWHYDERASRDPQYPNNKPSLGDYSVSRPGEYGSTRYNQNILNGNGVKAINNIKDGFDDSPDTEVLFSPPGPCYAGLKTNVPSTLMFSSLTPWPEGTEPSVPQSQVEEYIRRIAKEHGVDDVTLFHTRVDEVRKTGAKWEIRSVSLEGANHLVEQISSFDMVVVASGHYNMPRIPDIDGLKELKAAYPGRVSHSKQYRDARKYSGQNVLVVGAGVSALDICRELDGVANKTYQSVRGGMFDLSETLLPSSAVRVGAVTGFGCLQHDRLDGGEVKSLRGAIYAPLADGIVLADIDHVLLATGYITSYPFLRHLHSDTTPTTDAGQDVLVTSEGDMAHNLYKDMFYIPDPTLSFVGIPYHVATFSLFDFQAQALARIYAGKAHLPSQEEMRREYEERVREKGYGRGFHSLYGAGQEVAYVQALVELVNRDIDGTTAVKPMLPHSESWVREYEAMRASKKVTSFPRAPVPGEQVGIMSSRTTE
ncbi:hypothetical protein B0H66DRAFT_566840 [Apodospora peruviana]|uniref:FAD dependent oxidoreductase domain-containing protein n=1 Tax=Apodospora peruviana TaxID=516989 RepID=A0AAE0HXC1_9PEZI|nr:hypothetical protein B0H66DRAFT_566840 [Apodospora peruviana]